MPAIEKMSRFAQNQRRFLAPSLSTFCFALGSLAFILAALFVTSLWAIVAEASFEIGCPDALPTEITQDGAIHEPWGDLRLSLQGSTERSLKRSMVPRPVVVIEEKKGSVTLRSEIFRAPIWPHGADVLIATVQNTGKAPSQAELVLSMPETVELSDRCGFSNRQCVLCLPGGREPKRKTREWGWVAGGEAMPGWARPVGQCDPAFRNIRAGMGGVPLIYKFRVEPGSKWKVAIGLCESYWSDAGQRPIDIYVEGAEKKRVDPLALWGQHHPGCILFDAQDEDGDGVLQIVSAPVKGAPDTNPILNVIWIFPSSKFVDSKAVVRGKLNKLARYYVDVGGKRDQGFYLGGEVRYPLTLPPGDEETLTFLMAGRPGALVNPEDSCWSAESLRKAAADVWSDWFAQGGDLEVGPLRSWEWRRALAHIVMNRIQLNGFYLVLDDKGRFSPSYMSLAVRVLDLYGFRDEAERILRVWTDRFPGPGPRGGGWSMYRPWAGAATPDQIERLQQRDDGRWPEVDGARNTQSLALLTICKHALFWQDREWAKRLLPRVEKGATWLMKSRIKGESIRTEMAALGEVAEFMRFVGRDAAPFRAKAEALRKLAVGSHSENLEKPSVIGVAEEVRAAVLRDTPDQLALLEGVRERDLEHGEIRARRMPTRFGPVSLTCTREGTRVRVELELSEKMPKFLMIRVPRLKGQQPKSALVSGKSAKISEMGTIQFHPKTKHVVVEIAYSK